MSNSEGVSREAEDAYLTGTPGLSSQFLVEVAHLLTFILLVILVISCSLLCVSVFPVQSLSLEHIFFIFIESWFP